MRTLVPVLIGCSLLATGCRSGAEAQPAAACQQPSAALVERIEGSARAGTDLKVLASAAQREGLTNFVAVRFTAGGRTQTGVWAVGPKLDGTGTLLAVDANAQRWSEALAGDVAAAGLQKTEGAEALGCLG